MEIPNVASVAGGDRRAVHDNGGCRRRGDIDEVDVSVVADVVHIGLEYGEWVAEAAMTWARMTPIDPLASRSPSSTPPQSTNWMFMPVAIAGLVADRSSVEAG